MILRPMLDWWWVLLITLPMASLCGWLIVRGPGEARPRWGARLAAVSLVAMTLLRPGIPGAGDEAAVRARDVDVLIAVDITASMGAVDMGGDSTRLAKARQDIQAIVDAFPGARFSVVTFGKRARIEMPWSTDASAARSVAEYVQPEDVTSAQGSSISEPVTAMTSQLKRSSEQHPERARLVFYLGDGEQTSGKAPQSFEEIAPLVSGGRVLGYGTKEGGRMRQERGSKFTREHGYVQDGQGREAVSTPDEKALRMIASQLGVRHEQRTDHEAALPHLDKELKTAERAAESETDRKASMALEMYWIVAGLAGTLVLLDLAWSIRQQALLRPRRERP